MISAKPWGELDGRPVGLWRVERDTSLGRMAIAVSDYGATLQALIVPDAGGAPTDVVLGHDTLAEYVAGETYFGAIAGRYGNRIRDGRFTLDGVTYQLDRNEGGNHLHGGSRGFDRQVWDASPTPEGNGVRLALASPDGDMGYPGRLALEVTYRIAPEGGLDVDMEARTDRPTLCNPVQHSYFNLAGEGHVLEQVAQFHAGFYTPVDGDLLATGEIASVVGTPFDFREEKPFGRDMAAALPASGAGAGLGYDHNLVLGLPGADGLREAATIRCPSNGLAMSLRTTEPGVQLYTGGYLVPEVRGKGGRPSVRYGGFTLETQAFPGSPGFAHFPQAVLRPGETYRHAMRLRFAHTS